MAKRAASDPDTLDIVKARMPVSGGGPLSADDHAQAALFLCSDESKHITGQLSASTAAGASTNRTGIAGSDMGRRRPIRCLRRPADPERKRSGCHASIECA